MPSFATQIWDQIFTYIEIIADNFWLSPQILHVQRWAVWRRNTGSWLVSGRNDWRACANWLDDAWPNSPGAPVSAKLGHWLMFWLTAQLVWQMLWLNLRFVGHKRWHGRVMLTIARSIIFWAYHLPHSSPQLPLINVEGWVWSNLVALNWWGD